MKPIHLVLIAFVAGAGYFFYTKSKQTKTTGGFSASINIPMRPASSPVNSSTQDFSGAFFI